jgi:hypothetical protein
MFLFLVFCAMVRAEDGIGLGDAIGLGIVGALILITCAVFGYREFTKRKKLVEVVPEVPPETVPLIPKQPAAVLTMPLRHLNTDCFFKC